MAKSVLVVHGKRAKMAELRKKILVVDDDLGIVKMLASRLKANDYDIVTAGDGTLAVQKAHAEKPDLVILDIMLPAGYGYSVLQNLRASTHTALIPIIFCSALPREEIERKAAELGAEDFITKPFDAEEVIAKVKKILGE